MNFIKILQTLATTSVEFHQELIPLVLLARVELKRLSGLQANLEDPAVVFERWALPPRTGLREALIGDVKPRYTDIQSNAAYIGFMQCYTWLQPQIEALQAKATDGTNTPDVLQNDKITFHFAKLSDAESMNVEGPAGPLTELLKNTFCDVYPKTVGFKDRTIVDEDVKRFLKKQSNESDWVLWEGGENPFEETVRVEVKYSTGRVEIENSDFVQWSRVLAYRLVAPQTNTHATPLDTQVGGSHYTEMAIQPFEYSMRNGLDPCQHTAIKYITRFRQKGGIADLDKAIHTIELLKHFESSK